MNDAEYEAQKERVRRYLYKWQWLVEDEWWLKYIYDRERDKQEGEDENTGARVTTAWEYREALLKVFLPATAELKDEERERIIVHEFAHIMVCEMRLAGAKEDDPDGFHNEHVCSTIAMVLLKMDNRTKGVPVEGVGVVSITDAELEEIRRVAEQDKVKDYSPENYSVWVSRLLDEIKRRRVADKTAETP